MASRGYAEQHIALVKHLLAEKDRLILEKDELVASKDRMWRELSAIVLNAMQNCATTTYKPD